MASKTRIAIGMLLSLFLLAIPCGFILAQSPRQQHTIALANQREITTGAIKASISLVIESHPEKHELFARYYTQAEQLLQTLTLEQKIGQMFLARFPGANITEEIAQYYPGGYILFSQDFASENKASITAKLAEYQKSSQIPLFLAVDEEGGSVVRISNHAAFRAKRFSSPQELQAEGGLSAIIQDSGEKSALLKRLGLNMNLAPVADVATDPRSFIYDRTYGQNAQATATYVAKVVQTMKQDEIISVLKHFPGYGNNTDTHSGSAIDARPYQDFLNNDFLPFIAGIQAGAPCILVNHNLVTAVDAKLPASLSPAIHHILRQELHFSGLIITDDLVMGAVESQLTPEEAAEQAVLAGNDLIISSDLAAQSQAILQAVHSGKISETQIDQAVKRILACKYAYGILASI